MAMRRAIEGPDLHRGVAFGQQLLGELHRRMEEFPGVLQWPVLTKRTVARPARIAADDAAIRGIAATVVDLHAIAHRPTEEAVNGLAADLPENVPERDIDGGDRAELRAAYAE